MWNALLELLFPRGCAGCGARPVPGAFCAPCSRLVEPLQPWRCPVCAEPFAPGVRRGRCAPCGAGAPPFERVVAPFAHGGAVAEAIYRLKYRGRREVARSLAPLLASSASGLLADVDAIAPIPLHRTRRRTRGYDQALLLARELSRISRRPLRPRLLARVRETQQQVGLDRAGRGRNLEGAFEASPEARGLRIALVDDVVTTGATARAAAGALARMGAKGIVVLALARAGT